MQTRITTKAIMSGYNRGLNAALNRWNNAQNRVLTQRNFNEMWEDPAGANRSFQLRNQFRQNATHIELTKQTQAHMDDVVSSTMQITKIMTKDINPDVLESVNGTTSASDKRIYAETLRGMQKSIVLAANSQTSGTFVFAGEDTKNVPFVLSEDGKTLTYRGIDVTTGLDADGKDCSDKLEEMTKETLFVDLGFGMKEDVADENNPEVIKTSAFNMAVSGLNLLGYGEDEETGLPNNVVTLLGQMADKLEEEPFDQEGYDEMIRKYHDCIGDVTEFEADLGTKQQFLDSNLTRLEQSNDTLNKRIVDVERVDMPEAISSYMWQGYAYNAALKVGMNIVSQSLLDYMN